MERVNRCKARQLLDGVLAAEGRVTGETRTLFLDMNGIALRASLADRRRSPRPPIRAWRTSPRRRWWPGATWIFRMCGTLAPCGADDPRRRSARIHRRRPPAQPGGPGRLCRAARRLHPAPRRRGLTPGKRATPARPRRPALPRQLAHLRRPAGPNARGRATARQSADSAAKTPLRNPARRSSAMDAVLAGCTFASRRCSPSSPNASSAVARRASPIMPLPRNSDMP